MEAWQNNWMLAGCLLAALTLMSGCGGGGGEDDDQPATSAGVSGVITAAEGSAIDGDVNDPFAPFSPNNNPASAQALPNPVTVGGFASAVGTGVAGDRFATAGDVVDAYRATLAAGQTITIRIADHEPRDPTLNDLDLALFSSDDPTEPVATSLGTGPAERITVPAPGGEYDVVIEAASGLSNYTLTIGQTANAAADALRIEDEFVPGEVIARFKASRQPAGAGVETLQAHANALGLQAMAGGAEREMLFSLSDRSQRAQAFAALGINVRSKRKQWGGWGAALAKMNAMERLKRDTIAVVKALRGRADVASADLNYLRHASRAPNDELYPRQWHYPLINLPQAWDVSTGSANLVVAVADTGVFLAHPDLSSKLTGTGYDFVADAVNAGDGNGIDANADDPGDSGTPGGSSFHGTHVAGTIAAASNNAQGVSGVSWQTRIMPVRVLGRGGVGTTFDIIQGLRYAAGLPNDSGIILARNNRADIINLSLGGSSFSQSEQNVYSALRNAGVIVIAAAGNESTGALSYPASYDGVVSVSAVDRRRRLAPYSNFGSEIDVAAPGGDTRVDRDGDGFVDGVLSTSADDSGGARAANFVFYQGTSMAAPHIAGVVGLMKAVHPNLTPGQLDAVLAAGSITEDLARNGAPNRDNNFGFGLIDALKAVRAANRLANGAPLPAILEIEPTALDFGATQTTRTLTASNSSQSPLAITGVTDDQPWLTVTPAAVDANGLGTYTVTVDRGGLVDAAYGATIRFNTNTAGTVTALVNMRVGTISAIADTGFQFVLLIEPDTFETAAGTGVGNVGGAYNYRFTDVRPGNYLIQAGTDSDNDGFICDGGESCGGYPTRDLLEPVAVADGNVGGLNFTSSFNVGFSGAATSVPRRGFSRLPAKRVGE